TDLEASFEQYKVEQAVSQAELKETMEKNKVDTDKQFAEILQLEPFRSWEDLKRRMLVRFQSSQAGTLHEQFFAISQSGTARDYITMFEKMAAQLPRLQEEVLEGIFIKGLKQELRMTAANRTGGDSSRPPAVVAGGASFKRMTNSEFADKKSKGLCYRCDGKFLPGYRCPEKALQLLLMDDDEEEEIEGGASAKSGKPLIDQMSTTGSGLELGLCVPTYGNRLKRFILLDWPITRQERRKEGKGLGLFEVF
ncbi:ankyrin repeat-containing protein, partial [Tanacetum coccineum]